MPTTVDWSKPIQTRDGRPARRVGVLKRRSLRDQLVAIMDDNEEFTLCVDTSGKASDIHLDIINVPPPKRRGEVWVNIYPEGASCAAHKSRESADEMAQRNRIACVCKPWTEGEGL